MGGEVKRSKDNNSVKEIRDEHEYLREFLRQMR
jgi:hypothetical protein